MAAAKQKKAEEIVNGKGRRRLTDLYIVGTEVEFNDGTDDPIVVWIQKLTPSENQKAIDAAKPAKSKITAIKRLPDDDPAKAPFLDELEDASLLTKMDRIRFLISPKEEEIKISKEYEISDQKEWSEDDYLIGLQTAWNEGLRDVWLEDQDDEEASRVYNELRRFTDQLEKEVEAERNELIYEIQDLSEQEIEKKTVNSIIEKAANKAIVDEYRMQQIYYATRDIEDHSKKYFESRDELELLHANVINKLLMEYFQMSVEPMEGKD